MGCEGRRSRLVVGLLGVLVCATPLLGCSDEGVNIFDGPAVRHEPEMFRQVLTYLTDPARQPADGDWSDDFGDANYYGVAFFQRYGMASGVAGQLELAARTKAYDLELLASGSKNISVFIDKLDYLLMGALGLTELHGLAPDAGSIEQLNSFVSVTNLLAKGFNYYPVPSPSLQSYAIDTYGASTMNATLALLNLEHALYVGGDTKAQRLADAKAILKRGEELGYDATLGYYRFNPGIDSIYLYPNVSQMLAHVRAYELTGEKPYLERAEALYEAIQPLKVAGEGRYRSPYSAKHMGAQTDDYTTFSSQNYAMLAFALLYQQTKDPKYRQEILDILAFLKKRLLREGRVLHHVMDGRIAMAMDPEFYCSGCNIQLLYVIWRLEEILAT